MSYIAKAMSKQTGLDAAAGRAEREAHSPGEAERPAGDESSEAAGAPASELEFVEIGDDRPNEPQILKPGPAARKLAGMNARPRSEPPELPPEMLGTLEAPPPESAPASRGSSRAWWKEPIVLGGGALGVAALLIGFLFAPDGGPPGSDTPSGAAPMQIAPPAQDNADEGATASAEGADAEAAAGEKSSDRKPVVVRVQIDSGDGNNVEFEAGESRSSGSSSSPPKMPEVYEPLQPLELPPPPVADYDYATEDPEPSSSSSGSRYASPPPGDSISDYRLEGIFWSEENPGVIINDEIVDEGERINQLRVVEIHKDFVEVELNGRTYDLR